MNLLNIENISKAYTERMLFDGASFYLEEGEKVGIIGINGTGKSTLLKIISGIEKPDKGTVTRANNIVIGYLPQHPEFTQGINVIDYVMSEIDEHDESRFSIEASAKSMLNTFGIDNPFEIIDNMSGGQKKKIALVKVLLDKNDILIMDEPTNHLDNEMSAWLENYLRTFRGSLVMVTHDRYFLDGVTNRIVEIDKGNLYSYKTNYSGFLELKAEREEMAMSTDDKKANLLRNELKWVMRGAKARSTKQKARLERYEELKNRKKFKADSQIEISSVSTRLGKTTVELEKINKAYGDKTLIKDFNYIFLKDDRCGIIGPNGCGKTTLMKMITGDVKPDTGTITIGQTVKVGYYAQEIQATDNGKIDYMNPELSVIEYIRNTAEYVKTKNGIITASQMLEKFLFGPKSQYSLIKTLSGGEKRRLNLLRVLMEAPNVLILDEPTNDLDIKTLTILEDYLDSFDGIVITVSHDRYFLDRVVSRLFVFEGNGKIRQFEGGYSDYAIVREFENQDIKNPESEIKINENKTVKIKDKKLKFTYAEQKEFETIEEDIEKLESRIDEIDKEMVENASDFVKLNELTREKTDINDKIEFKLERWEYLTELAEKIKNQ